MGRCEGEGERQGQSEDRDEEKQETEREPFDVYGTRSSFCLGTPRAGHSNTIRSKARKRFSQRKHGHCFENYAHFARLLAYRRGYGIAFPRAPNVASLNSLHQRQGVDG